MGRVILLIAIVSAVLASVLCWWKYRTAISALLPPVIIASAAAVLLYWNSQLSRQDGLRAPGPRTTQAVLTMNDLNPTRPIEVATHGYIGSAACLECHPDNHATWAGSYHSTMTQVAHPDNVLGNFDDVQVTHNNLTYSLSQSDQFCTVELPDPENPQLRASAPIVMTTGSHHMQVYWFGTGNARTLAMLPLVHLNETDEWIPRSSAFLRPTDDHPSFEVGRWNGTCSACHSTHRKGRPQPFGDWDTHVGEFGISCEACHGPGRQHVDLRHAAEKEISRPDFPGLPQNDPIVNPASLSKERSAQVCGQCHAVIDPLQIDQDYETDGHDYRPGMDLAETHGVWNRDSPELRSGSQWKQQGYADLDSFLNRTFYADGMIRVSGREYNGLLQSKCYVDGQMTCLTCHQMHKADTDTRSLETWANDQLRPESLGNETCLDCHDAKDYSTNHTHHLAESSGSQCYNCHMPHSSYGLLKAIRSHQISSPDVGKDESVARPNACNQCHLDQTLAWSAKHLHQWYGTDMPELDADQSNIAASILWMLRGDAAQRALSAWTMGWPDAQETSGKDWQLPFLIMLLNDEYDAIRLIARRSIRTFPAVKDLDIDVVTETSRQQRQILSTRLFMHWRESTASTRVDRPKLLIKQETGFDAGLVQRLISQRDNTTIDLAE